MEINVDAGPIRWLPMASIRSSENNFMRYVKDKDYFRGMTLPHEIVSWLRSLGDSDIVNRTSLLFDQPAHSRTSQPTLRSGRSGHPVHQRQVDVHGSNERGVAAAHHWVVQTAPFIIMRDSVSVAVFSRGDSRYGIPRDGRFMPIKDFLNHFYGYIAASM